MPENNFLNSGINTLNIKPFLFQPQILNLVTAAQSEDRPVAQVLDALHANMSSRCVELVAKNIKFKSGSEPDKQGLEVFSLNGFETWFKPDFDMDVAGQKRFIEIINMDNKDSIMYQKFAQTMRSSENGELRLLGSREGILQYLFAYARFELDHKTDENIFLSVADNSGTGIRHLLVTFIVEKAVQKVISDNGFSVSAKDLKEKIIPGIDIKNLSFKKAEFTETAVKAIKGFLHFKTQNNLLSADDIALFEITPKEKVKILQYFKEKGVTKAAEASKLIPYLLTTIRAHQNEPEPIDLTEADESDFFVAAYDDADTTVLIEKQNIYCAAQLFFVMTFGEEMNLFNLMDKIIETYPIDFRSRQLQRDVQLFQENNQVLDLKTGQVYFRTQEERRHALYNAVFNDEFNMRLENFLEKIGEYYVKMENRDSGYINLSRHEILQGAEEFQYHISSTCVGIAKIITPAAYREVDFIIRRFLQNDEISTQVAPLGNGSFFKVIEEAWRRTMQEKINARNYYQKAELGKELIRMLADCNAVNINDDEFLGKLVSIGKSFITVSQEIDQSDENNGIPYNRDGGMPGMPGMNDMINGFIPQDNQDDEWI